MNQLTELRILNSKTHNAFRWIAFLVIGIALYGAGLIIGGMTVSRAYTNLLVPIQTITTCKSPQPIHPNVHLL